ncbi:Hypothetical predicted protein [Olea europaea subsp. europaea]|uniref:Uncharacterized protein n=1 Tax=Olea europaea subsp. europaea TaxID=158383 RepID=A0A8S0UB02_OLEEU|nr:Hypothetical predicted protein [Olea europaea subsp. europaea]
MYCSKILGQAGKVELDFFSGVEPAPDEGARPRVLAPSESTKPPESQSASPNPQLRLSKPAEDERQVQASKSRTVRVCESETVRGECDNVDGNHGMGFNGSRVGNLEL